MISLWWYAKDNGYRYWKEEYSKILAQRNIQRRFPPRRFIEGVSVMERDPDTQIVNYLQPVIDCWGHGTF